MTSFSARTALVALAIALPTLACSGSGSSPTSPSVAGLLPTEITTRWGSLTLVAGDCGGVDSERIAASVADGYRRAASVAGAVVDTVSLEGMMMRGISDLDCGGAAAYGCYFFDRDEVLFRCGYENVVEHELQHRLCDRLDRSCDCHMVDHSGGTNLNCQPI